MLIAVRRGVRKWWKSDASGGGFSSVFASNPSVLWVRRRVRKWWKSGASGAVFSSVFERILM